MVFLVYEKDMDARACRIDISRAWVRLGAVRPCAHIFVEACEHQKNSLLEA